MKKLSSIFFRFLLIVSICFGGTVTAQPPGTVTPTVTQNGYSLQKSTSLSSVKTGDPFTYTVTFSVPGGATSVTVVDVVPAPLVVDNVIVPVGGCSGNVPVVSTNPVAGGTQVSLTFPPIVGSISCSFQINVHFPVEKSCNGLVVYNNAKIVGKNPDVQLVTERLADTAIVDNPWRIWKSPVAQYIGGACPYGVISDTVEYFIQIAKQSWVLSGSASLYSIALFDVMPAGATVVPGSFSTSANLTGSTINNVTGVVTPPGGFFLDATGSNYYWMRLKLKYTPLSTTICSVNKAVLQGKYDCNGTPSPVYKDSSQIGVIKIPAAPNPTMWKWASVNGNVPGCTGTFFVQVCNLGTASMSPYVLSDNFPGCVTGVTTSAPAGCSITGPVAGVYTINGTSLAPGQCHTYSFSFTIGVGCPNPITNTVSVTSGFTSPVRSASVALLPDGAKPCITKSICGPNNYTVGSIVRFRLRIQNIGDDPLLGTNIQDNLDNGSLQYVGNENYYTFPNPFAPCAPNNTTPPAGGSAWTGVATAHNIPAGQLKWLLPTIGIECGNVSYPACGYAYGLKAYYIEFSVKIKDTAGLGNIKNIACIQGGNITTSVCGDVTFVTNGNLNYNVSKFVSSDGGATFSSSANAGAGTIVQYKLNAVNTGISLVNPMVLDLLPRDNGASDNYIMSAAARGSAYDVRYNSFISTSHTIAASGQWYSNVSGINTTPELGFTVNGNAPGWSLAIPANTANIKTYFSQAFGSALPLNYIFGAKTSSTATVGQVACNSFVLRGSAKYIINYTPSYILQPTSPDAALACVTITNPPCCQPYDYDIPESVCVGVSQQYCMKDSCTQPGNTYYWDFGDGSPVVTGKCVNHIYTTTGSYTIKVYWHNECGEFSKTFKVDVKECCCDPYDFAIPETACVKISQQYCVKDSCPQPGNTYYWDFGDGSPVVTGKCLNHTYFSTGSYTIKIWWHNDCGEYSKDFKVEVKECSCDINVCYKVSTNGLDIVADASCTTSSFPIAIYVWDFGDGSFGTGMIANHTYTNPGGYTVRLTVYAMDENGDICKCVKECKTDIRVDYGKKWDFGCGEWQSAKNPQVPAKSDNITLKATPNPFTDKLVVAVDFIDKAKAGDHSNYLMQLTSVNGTILQSKRLVEFEKNPVFNTMSYPSGSYFVMLKNMSGQIQSIQVVKIQ
jgi:hypothetical protein